MEKQVIGYTRVSTTGQAENGCSLDLQRDKIQQYSKLNNLILDRIIEDRGKKSSKLNQELNELIKQDTVDHLIIYKLDRLIRDMRGALDLADLLLEHNCTLHSVSETIDLTTPQGRLSYNISVATSVFELEQLRDRTKQALQGKKNRGEVYNHVSYGYQLSADGKHLEHSQEEQRVIKKIRKLHREGMSQNGIAAKLNQLGYTTKLGRKWTNVQVRNIMSEFLRKQGAGPSGK
jgi:site-specific DNA recombinase